jgi:hypothetical protein
VDALLLVLTVSFAVVAVTHDAISKALTPSTLLLLEEALIVALLLLLILLLTMVA